MERIAARCVTALRRFQPRGPYQLAGWCLAGVVAFEMARQLAKQGEQVPMLGLFDARGILPLRGSKLRTQWISCHENWIKVKYHLGELRGRRKKLRDTMNHFAKRPQPAARHESQGDLTDLALARYQPEPYAGSIVHFWSTDRPPSRYREFPGEWTPYANGSLTLHEIPGNHITMFQHPNVEILARRLREHLTSVDELAAHA